MNILLLWEQFEQALILQLDKTTSERLLEIWRKSELRTTFYANEFFPNIAKEMKLSFKKEILRVDYMFCKKSNKNNIPWIAIESENLASTATQEVRKLACIAAPLRILVTVGEWSIGKMLRDKYLASWKEILIAQNAIWPNTGGFGIIVGEWEGNQICGTLRFHALLMDHTGSIIREEKTIFTKNIFLRRSEEIPTCTKKLNRS